MLSVICGSMYSGKSEELIRRVRRLKFAKKEVLVIRHSSDNRYDESSVSSHNQTKIEAINLSTSKEIKNYINNMKVKPYAIAIDEIQFFDEGVVDLLKELRKEYEVIVSGLDTDFRGEPFAFMGTLLAIAEHVDKLHAVCVVCGKEASKTQRLVNGKPAKYDDPIILVGATECYEARCDKCHEVIK